MSLASDDIWQKFDLAKSEFIKMEQEEMDTVTNNIYQMMKPTKSTDSLVPDIDMLAFSSNLDVDINMDGGIDMDFDSLLEDILGFQDKPLRHDCMWSGDMSTNEEKSLMLLNTNSEPKNKPDIAPSTNMNLGSITKDLDCFDTPLSSETSDLDETSSDIDGEVEVGTINSRLQGSRDTLKSNQDITYSDHCYIATSKRDIIKTREESSDDDDSNPSQHINPSNTFRIPNHPVRVSPIHTKPVNKPKFKFHMKFNSTSLQSSRSLLRRPRLQYPRQNGFKLPVLPNTSKTIQISPARVSKEEEDQKLVDVNRMLLKNDGKPRDVRDLHNSLERQRRIDLKNAFDRLKSSVPDLAVCDKASKLQILIKSADYCQRLVSVEAKLIRDLDTQRSRHQTLSKKLKMMRSRK